MIHKHSADAPYIGCDLDGTLAEAFWPHAGEFHPLKIGAPIMPMVERIRQHLAEGHKVKIFTARVGPRGKSPNNKGIKLIDINAAIGDWTERHIGTRLEATCTKDYNMVMLYDDRAVRILHNQGIPCCADSPV